MLPLALICLLQAHLAYAQASAPLSLSLNSLYSSYPTAHAGRPALFSIPVAQNASVSVALCASAGSPPRFLLSNSSAVTHPTDADLGEEGVYEIVLGSEGYGWWTGVLSEGGFLSVEDMGQTPFEIGVSGDGQFACAFCCFSLICLVQVSCTMSRTRSLYSETQRITKRYSSLHHLLLALRLPFHHIQIIRYHRRIYRTLPRRPPSNLTSQYSWRRLPPSALRPCL